MGQQGWDAGVSRESTSVELGYLGIGILGASIVGYPGGGGGVPVGYREATHVECRGEVTMGCRCSPEHWTFADEFIFVFFQSVLVRARLAISPLYCQHSLKFGLGLSLLPACLCVIATKKNTVCVLLHPNRGWIWTHILCVKMW